MNTMFAIGTYPLPATIERFGRRNIMFWSAFVCALFMTAFVVLIGISNPTRSMQWGAAVVICIWNMVFGYGWIGVPWLYGPEVCLHFLLILPLAHHLSIEHSSLVNKPTRLHPSSIVTLAELLARLVNGSLALSLCSQGASHLRTSAGRYGSGCCYSTS
jgi:hypothetical protein